MRTNTITLALSIMASLGSSSVSGQEENQVDSSSVPAQEENQDEVHPALLHPFWLGLSPLAAPYTLTEADREKFGGSFGVDLSHYSFDIANSDPKCKTQSGYTDPSCSCTINWEILSDNKLQYVYMKATDGAAVDLSFPRFWSELEPKHASNLLFRGAYHFLRPGVDPEKQANTFLRAIGAIDGRKPAQLPPVLDIEWSNKRVKPGTREFKACPKNRLVKNDKGIYYCDMWFRVSSAGIAAMAKEWIDKVERGTGRPVIIYTNPTGWWNPVMEDSGEELMKKQAVWTSRYTSAGPQYDSK
jgi:GH25 family lysozyme M1 (1,4-beta-N-acetylmuramidase)